MKMSYSPGTGVHMKHRRVCCTVPVMSSLFSFTPYPLLAHAFRWDTVQNSAMGSLTWPARRDDHKCDGQMQRVYC